jgi:hypothetical protein
MAYIPKKKGIGYKAFFRDPQTGKLYPPMVGNKGNAFTQVGKWLDAYAPAPYNKREADIEQRNVPAKYRRYTVKAVTLRDGKKKTSHLSYRPGWHLGDVPHATQFNYRVDNKSTDIVPDNIVWGLCEYAADVHSEYQKECNERMHWKKNAKTGKYQRYDNPTYANGGMNRIPERGYYRFRTNPHPASVEWIITGNMRVVKILTKAEVDEILRKEGIQPQKYGHKWIELGRYKFLTPKDKIVLKSKMKH